VYSCLAHATAALSLASQEGHTEDPEKRRRKGSLAPHPEHVPRQVLRGESWRAGEI
jgi:hypothetical protein